MRCCAWQIILTLTTPPGDSFGHPGAAALARCWLAGRIVADSLQPPRAVPFPEGSRPKLLDQVRHTIRMRHYSRRTETTYVHWIRRFIVFHHKKHPSTMGAPAITAFLSWLATGQRVSSSTQNQALGALLFLYRHVLRIEVGAIDQVPRAKLPHRVPVVLSREEVGRIFQHIQGTMWMVAALLYGAGLRLQECLELRVKDLDFDRHEIVVRRGKGQKDRRTMLPVGIEERLRGHLREVRRQHDRDLADGVGRVVLPFCPGSQVSERRH
jgi:site-specific recombinase XerD